MVAHFDERKNEFPVKMIVPKRTMCYTGCEKKNKLFLRRKEDVKMITILVCVGSSCHLHGSTEVIRRLQVLIREHGLMDEVELKGVFCQGQCTRPVAVMVDEDLYSGVDPESVAQLFETQVLPKVGKR